MLHARREPREGFVLLAQRATSVRSGIPGRVTAPIHTAPDDGRSTRRTGLLAAARTSDDVRAARGAALPSATVAMENSMPVALGDTLGLRSEHLIDALNGLVASGLHRCRPGRQIVSIRTAQS